MIDSTLAWTLDLLSRTVAFGGNLLLNVGPKGDGSLPEGAHERLAELGEWMRHSGRSIEGVERGPWPERANAPVTRQEGVWYVHVLADHDGTVEVREVPEPSGVRLLRTGESVAYAHEGETLTVEVPAADRESPDEFVAISWSTSHHLL